MDALRLLPGPSQSPGSADAERGLLGIVIRDNASYYQVEHELVAGDFIEELHGELWLLVRDLIEAGRTLTAATLVHDAQDAIVWGNIKCSAYLNQLVDDAPPPHVVAGLAHTVKEMSRRRRLISLADELRQLAIDAPASVTSDELRGKAEEAVSAIFADAADLGLKSIAAVGDMVLERLRQKEREIGLVMPLKAQRELIGPLMPGRLYMLGGPPGSGKSALLLQTMLHSCRRYDKVGLLHSIEMGDEEQAERSLAGLTGFNSQMFERGIERDRDYETAWTANEGDRATRLFIDRDPSPTMARIRGRATRLKKMEGLHVLGVDHIHYVAKTDPRTPDFEALDDNLKRFKQLAKDLKIPVILLCQFSTDALRDLSKSPWRMPTQADLLYSGIIERHADIIALVYRREYTLRRSQPLKSDPKWADWNAELVKEIGKASLILTKRRGGTGWGRDRLGFHGETVQFSDENLSARVTEDREGLPLGGGVQYRPGLTENA